ncbi:MAG: site-2 protease family protein [Mariprofundales bacterium]
MDIASFLHNLLLWAPVVIIAVVIHEVAHGKMADLLGDSTARMAGRLTLNPIPHIDIVGTIVIPALLLLMSSPILFGYAKPVPVNFNRLNKPKRDMVFVALAGPVSNVLLALLFTLLLALCGFILPYITQSIISGLLPFLMDMCVAAILINLILALFNMLPIPPLDGGRVAVGLLPLPWSQHLSRIEPFGFFIVIALLMFGWLQSSLAPLVIGGMQMLVSIAL